MAFWRRRFEINGQNGRRDSVLKRSGVSFSFLLPFLELAIWVMVVLAPSTLVYFQLRRAAERSHDNSVVVGGVRFNLSREQLYSLTFFSTHGKAIEAANLPGIFIEVALSLPTTWPASWHPHDIEGESWRVLSLPVYCAPFWWFAGLGMDALAHRRRLHVSVFFIGSLLCSVFAFVFFGTLIAGVGEPADRDMNWLVSGLCLWAILFGAFPAAWYRQRSLAKKEAGAAKAPVPQPD
jgi:hypothetical protein